MADDRQSRLKNAADMASAALDALKAQRKKTDEAVALLKQSGSTDGLKSPTIASGLLAAESFREAGLLAVESNRELSCALIAATEIVDHSIQQLNVRIEDFTLKADKGTNRLATWTMVLAIGTLLLFAATAGLVYATLNIEPPLIVNVPKP